MFRLRENCVSFRSLVSRRAVTLGAGKRGAWEKTQEKICPVSFALYFGILEPFFSLLLRKKCILPQALNRNLPNK